MSQQRATVANRVQKVLEDANIKVGSVASDVLGRSGMAILQALIAGQQDVVLLANMARGRLKSKTNQLRKSLEGRLTDHHRFLLGELLDQVQYLDQAIARVSAEIERRMVPLQEAVRLLDTIPGIDRRAAENLIAELGPDMSQFPTARNLASWAGMCPGQNESAGKRRSGRTRKGSRWLRRSLYEAAWAGTRTKGTYLKAQYHRLAARRGRKRAIMAVGHTILVVVYHLLKHVAVYQELRENFFDHLQRIVWLVT